MNDGTSICFEDLLEAAKKIDIQRNEKNNINPMVSMLYGGLLSNTIYGSNFGIRIIENVNLVDLKIEFVNRTWKERLFTIPWTPWKKTKVVQHKIPKQEFYLIDSKEFGGKVVICYPVMVDELKKSLNKVERLWLCDYGA